MAKYLNWIIYIVPGKASTLKNRSKRAWHGAWCMRGYNLPEEHASWVLDILLNLDQESDGFTTIQETVVICECQVHHLSQSISNVRGDSVGYGV